MRPQTIEMHIAELALHGFDGIDQAHLGAIVERELARLVVERGVPPALSQGGHIAHLDGGAFTVTPGSGPEALGSQIAQRLYGSLSQ